MRDYVQRLLSERYDVTAVADGQAAWLAAQQEVPDLVVTDVMMSGLDGFTLLRQLRADSRTKDVPVIILSARAGDEARIEGLEAAADDYLTKPFSAKELLASVRSRLELAAIRRETEQQLKDAAQRKDEFLATLAHELRNPLAPIRNGLHLMRLAGNDNTLVEKARTIMERQVQQMVRLVDDLLDVARISQNKLELRREWLELATVVNSAVETSRPIVDAAGHQLEVSIPPESIRLFADPVRLPQALSNLLNNAAKYSERGRQIWLTAEHQNDQVVLSVRDAGMGIPQDKLQHIFGMFVQADRSIENSKGGLGIGLALVQRIVRMHGGVVEARSEGHGKGSEFVIRLPAVPAANTAVHDETGKVDTSEATAPLRILVVDDNSDSAESLALMLKCAGHTVAVANDGLGALEVAKTFQPHAAFLDLGMPKLNGYDTARHIRQQPWGKNVVLIALTGWGQEEDKRRSKVAGFDAHLVKPVDHRALGKILADCDLTDSTNSENSRKKAV
jgi:signal transduction histidine kinase